MRVSAVQDELGGCEERRLSSDFDSGQTTRRRPCCSACHQYRSLPGAPEAVLWKPGWHRARWPSGARALTIVSPSCRGRRQSGGGWNAPIDTALMFSLSTPREPHRHECSEASGGHRARTGAAAAARVEYEAMVAQGLFADERIELLEGVIVEMSPAEPAPRSRRRAPDKPSLATGGWPSEPAGPASPGRFRRVATRTGSGAHPFRDYGLAHPTTAWLVVEVAEASLRKDRRVKGEVLRAGWRAGVLGGQSDR